MMNVATPNYQPFTAENEVIWDRISAIAFCAFLWWWWWAEKKMWKLS
jgi:hypothetical protein